MFTKATLDKGTLNLFGSGDQQTVCAFKRGTLTFNAVNQSIEFSKLDSIPYPRGFEPAKGKIKLAFYDSVTGELRTNKNFPNGMIREGEIKAKKDGGLYLAGASTTPKTNTGWVNKVFKLDAYFTHAGVQTDEFPQWLKDSARRQRLFWNRLVYVCKTIRQECSNVPVEAIQTFVNETLIPTLDKFNKSLSSRENPQSAKGAIKYPKNLIGDEPTIEAVWDFIGKLKKKVEEGRPVPEGLEQACRDFALANPANYQPLNKLRGKNLIDLYTEEADSYPQTKARLDAMAKAREVGSDLSKEEQDKVWSDLSKEEQAEYTERFTLRYWELSPLCEAFTKALDNQRVKKDFTKNWPRRKNFDCDWGIVYPQSKKPNVKLTTTLMAKGAFGLKLGSSIEPSASGHPLMRPNSRRSRRDMRQATITIPKAGTYNFAVLQDRKFPEEANIKDWHLVQQDGKLALCLTLELPPTPKRTAGDYAGIDIGWKRNSKANQTVIGTMYDPRNEDTIEFVLDYDTPATSTDTRTPFVVNMGPSRWGRRRLLRGLLPDTYEALDTLHFQRDTAKDAMKALIREVLKDETPEWLQKAGIKGIEKLMGTLTDETLKAAVATWKKLDQELGDQLSFISSKLAERLEKNYEYLAHDICRHLMGGVKGIKVETQFIKNVAENKNNYQDVALKKSQKYRHRAALGKFLSILKRISYSYGLDYEQVAAEDTTLTCSACKTVNAKGSLVCSACSASMPLDDANAATNIATNEPKKAKAASA